MSARNDSRRYRVWALGIVVLGTACAHGGGEHSATIRAGPMVGHGDMREVALWVQTTEPAEIVFRYRDTTRPERTYRTAPVTTWAETAFIARAIADSVEPGRRYSYEVWLNGRAVERPYPLAFQTPPLWRWRTDPPALRVAELGIARRNALPLYPHAIVSRAPALARFRPPLRDLGRPRVRPQQQRSLLRWQALDA
ncbi:MAG: hypothetical protein ABR527_04400 [Gemmatimonadota bacterium]